MCPIPSQGTKMPHATGCNQKKKKEKLKDSQITNAGKVMAKREPSNTVDGNVNWYSQCGK